MRKCDQCGESIWLANSSPKPDHLICVPCYYETLAMDEQIFHKPEELPVTEAISSPAAE
jgi:hypothetical protein